MTNRILTWIGWASVALYGALVTIGLIMQEATGRRLDASGVGADVIDAVVFALWMVVAAVISIRYPRHLVGWVMRAVALSYAFLQFAAGWAIYSTFGSGGPLPLTWLAAIYLNWVELGLLLLLAAVLLLIYPSGRLASPRWWPVVGVGVVSFLLLVANAATMSFLFIPTSGRNVSNPLALGWPRDATRDTLRQVLIVILIAVLIVAAVGVVLRLRRSSGVERQQLKWFAFAGSLYAIGAPIVFLYYVVVRPGSGDVVTLAGFDAGFLINIGGWLLVLGDFAIAVAIGIAILRYRLYDIDLVINRTLVYGSVVAILVAFYATAVFALQALLPVENDIAVAATTLAAAALFNPLRKRVQRLVDRRFYRSRYDAERVAAEFTARLRDEVDLETLTGEWVGVVQETVQPASISVWVKEAGRGDSG